MTKESYSYYDFQGKYSTTDIDLTYQNGNLSSMSGVISGQTYSYPLQYGPQQPSLDISSILVAPKSFSLCPQYALYMINGCPGNKNVILSFNGSTLSYVLDSSGYVTTATVTTSDGQNTTSGTYYFTYVDAGSQNYEYRTPFVDEGMGGTTWKYTEESRTWYLVFLNGSQCYFVEPELEYQEMIAGTYTKSGSTVSVILQDDSDRPTTCTLNGTSALVTSGGYFGGWTMVKTENFIF